MGGKAEGFAGANFFTESSILKLDRAGIFFYDLWRHVVDCCTLGGECWTLLVGRRPAGGRGGPGLETR